jgi:AcrR family transcriptional regulator
VAKTKMHAVEGSPGELVSTRNALVLAAESCISTRGFEATSIKDIATRAGVAKGNFYHYFSGKDEILRLILHRMLDDAQNATDHIPYDGLDFSGQVYAFISAIVGLVGQNRTGVAIFVQERHRLLLESFADVVGRSDEILVGRFGALLDRGIDQGQCRPLLSTKSMAVALFGMASWVYLWYVPGRVSLAKIADMYASVIVDGLCVERSNNAVAVAPKCASAVERAKGTPATTREALLRAALDLFAVKGYAGTTIVDIAKHGNLSTGAFFSQFTRKDEILNHIAIRYLDRLLEATDRVLEQRLPASETVARFMMELVGELGEHRIELIVYLQERPLLGTQAFPEVRARVDQLFRKLARLLKAGEQEGVFRPMQSHRVMAYGLFGLCALPVQRSEPGDVISQDIVQMYAEVILQGLRPRPEKKQPAKSRHGPLRLRRR